MTSQTAFKTFIFCFFSVNQFHIWLLEETSMIPVEKFGFCGDKLYQHNPPLLIPLFPFPFPCEPSI